MASWQFLPAITTGFSFQPLLALGYINIVSSSSRSLICICGGGKKNQWLFSWLSSKITRTRSQPLMNNFSLTSLLLGGSSIQTSWKPPCFSSSCHAEFSTLQSCSHCTFRIKKCGELFPEDKRNSIKILIADVLLFHRLCFHVEAKYISRVSRVTQKMTSPSVRRQFCKVLAVPNLCSSPLKLLSSLCYTEKHPAAFCCASQITCRQSSSCLRHVKIGISAFCTHWRPVWLCLLPAMKCCFAFCAYSWAETRDKTLLCLHFSCLHLTWRRNSRSTMENTHKGTLWNLPG